MAWSACNSAKNQPPPRRIPRAFLALRHPREQRAIGFTAGERIPAHQRSFCSLPTGGTAPGESSDQCCRLRMAALCCLSRAIAAVF